MNDIFFEYEVGMRYADIDHLKIQRAIALFPFSPTNIIMEAEESEGFFDRLIKKIKELFEKIKNAVMSLFKKDETQIKTEKLKKMVQADPNLAKAKVQMTDYDKLEKLNKQTESSIMATDVDEVILEKMEKYRKQRNTILAASSAITVTLGGLLVIMNKKKNNTISHLQEVQARTEENLKRVGHKYKVFRQRYENSEKKNEALKAANDKLNKKLEVAKAPNRMKKAQILVKQNANTVGKKVTSATDQVTEAKVKMDALVEVGSNTAKDIADSASNIIKVIANPNASIVSKVQAISKGTGEVLDKVKNVKSDVESATNNAKDIILDKREEKKAKEESSTKEIKAKLKDDIMHLTERRDRARNVIEDGKSTDAEKEHARAFLHASKQELERLKSEYKSK